MLIKHRLKFKKFKLLILFTNNNIIIKVFMSEIIYIKYSNNLHANTNHEHLIIKLYMIIFKWKMIKCFFITEK